MATIGFVGLGNMGGPMARNLLKAGHRLQAFDVAPGSLAAATEAGASAAASGAGAARGAEAVCTLRPACQQGRGAYLGPDGIIAPAARGALLIDCSTLDGATARDVQREAAKAGHEFVDAPVSGGTAGAAAAT